MQKFFEFFSLFSFLYFLILSFCGFLSLSHVTVSPPTFPLYMVIKKDNILIYTQDEYNNNKHRFTCISSVLYMLQLYNSNAHENETKIYIIDEKEHAWFLEVSSLFPIIQTKTLVCSSTSWYLRTSNFNL